MDLDALGTREALFAVQILVQRRRDVNYDIYICLTNDQKTIDNTKHDKLMTVLKATGLNGKDLRNINNNIRYSDDTILLTDTIQMTNGNTQ